MLGRSVSVSVDKKPRKGGTVRSVEIERADNDGFIVTCRYEQPTATKTTRYIEPSRQAFGNSKDMLRFVNKRMNIIAAE